MRGFSFDQAYGLPVEEQPVDQVVGDVIVFALGQIEGDVEVAQRGTDPVRQASVVGSLGRVCGDGQMGIARTAPARCARRRAPAT
ncbi:hypothetical protein ACPB9I_00400 [Streptomyces cellulosae]